jgi:hypothetical protein
VNTALIVLAKAPVPGLAKTRLAPALGAEGAARLATRLLHHTLAQAAGLPVALRELCVTPPTDHPAFAPVQAGRFGPWQLRLQGEGDLGQRMHRAFARVLGPGQPAGANAPDAALLMGTDAPALTTAVLAQAQAALHTHDAVWVPATDGGYALVGLRRPVAALFEGMTWSTPHVMAQTRQRAQAAGLHWAELPAVSDVDEPADLAHLPPGFWPEAEPPTNPHPPN